MCRNCMKMVCPACANGPCVPFMKKLDVVVVGELNVDLILDQIQGFPELGKEKIARVMTLTLGSSSAIFASNLSSLGARVGFIGKLGEDVREEVTVVSP